MNPAFGPDWPLLAALGAVAGALAATCGEWGLARYRQWHKRRTGAEPGWILAPALRTVFYFGWVAIALLGMWWFSNPARGYAAHLIGFVLGNFLAYRLMPRRRTAA